MVLHLEDVLTSVSYIDVLEFMGPIDVLALSTTCRSISQYLSDDHLKIWQYFPDRLKPELHPKLRSPITRTKFASCSKSLVVRLLSWNKRKEHGECVIHPLSTLWNMRMFLSAHTHRSGSITVWRRRGPNFLSSFDRSECEQLIASETLKIGDIFWSGHKSFHVIGSLWAHWCPHCYPIGRMFPYRSLLRHSPCHQMRPQSSLSDPRIIDNLFPKVMESIRGRGSLSVSNMELAITSPRSIAKFLNGPGSFFEAFHELEKELDPAPTTSIADLKLFPHLWRQCVRMPSIGFIIWYEADVGYALSQYYQFGPVLSQSEYAHSKVWSSRFRTVHDIYLDLDEFWKDRDF